MTRKSMLLIKLIVLILILIFLVFIVVAGFRGISDGFGSTFWNNSFIQGEATQEQQSFDNIDKIVVYSYSLPVTIKQVKRDDVLLIDSTTVSGFNSGNIKDNTYDVEQGTLYFEQGEVEGFLFGFNGANISGEIVIEVPEDVELEYEISGVSGAILLDAPSSEELYINSVSGSIQVNYGGEDLTVNNVSGSIDIMQPFETQDINTVSGSIDTYCDTDSTLLKVESISGSLDVVLSDGVNYEIDHSSVSGNVNESYSGGNSGSDKLLRIITSSVSGSVNITD